FRGITFAAAAVLQCDFNHALLEDRGSLLQDAGVAEAQFLVGPVLEVLDPVAGYRIFAAGFEEFFGQIVDEDLAAGGHYGDPAAEVLQLTDVSGPGQISEELAGFGAQ